MKKRTILILLLLSICAYPGKIYSSHFSHASPTNYGQWEHQIHFDTHKMPVNIKDIYIKEASDRYFFRFTTYQSLQIDQDFVFSVWYDTDQQAITGLQGDSCNPLGDEMFFAISRKKTGELKAVIAEYSEESDRMEKKLEVTPEYYSLLKRSIQFSLPKSYFPSWFGFDYLIMNLYITDKNDDPNDETDNYPGCGEKLTYPPNSKPKPDREQFTRLNEKQ